MNVGVVGNPSYRDLKSLLAHLAQAAPRLGLTLFAEERLQALWPAPPPALLGGPAAPDCPVTLGGDGPLLRGARTLNGAPTPTLAATPGRVGLPTTPPPHALD